MRLGSCWTVGFAASFALAACGPPAKDAESPTASPTSEGGDVPLPVGGGPPAKGAGVQQRLQGTWEISRYKSERPIPDTAMPLMGELFDSLRLRFDGDTVSARAGKQPEERGRFNIADEQGDSFRLVAKGGLFDGATCRFVDADTWEATDHGAAWPGVSLLRRVKR